MFQTDGVDKVYSMYAFEWVYIFTCTSHTHLYVSDWWCGQGVQYVRIWVSVHIYLYFTHSPVCFRLMVWTRCTVCMHLSKCTYLPVLHSLTCITVLDWWCGQGVQYVHIWVSVHIYLYITHSPVCFRLMVWTRCTVSTHLNRWRVMWRGQQESNWPLYCKVSNSKNKRN